MKQNTLNTMISMEEAYRKAEEIQSTLYSTEAALMEAIEDLKANAPEDFRIRSLKMQEYPGSGYAAWFTCGEVERELVISQEPWPSDPFEDTNLMDPMELISFNRKYSSKVALGLDQGHEKCESAESLLEDLWEETDPTSKSVDELLDTFYEEYYSQLNAERRENLYRQYIDGEEGLLMRESCREARDALMSGISDEMILGWIRDHFGTQDFESLTFGMTVRKKTHKLDAFLEKSPEDQVQEMLEEHIDEKGASFYAYSKLMEKVKKDWLIVPVMIADHGAGGIRLFVEKSDWYSLSDRCDAAIVAEKKAFAKTRFGEEWNEERHLSKALEMIRSDINYYQGYLSGDVWMVTAKEDGEIIQSIGDIDGNIEDVLEYVKNDLPSGFKKLIENDEYEIR